MISRLRIADCGLRIPRVGSRAADRGSRGSSIRNPQSAIRNRMLLREVRHAAGGAAGRAALALALAAGHPVPRAAGAALLAVLAGLLVLLAGQGLRVLDDLVALAQAFLDRH